MFIECLAVFSFVVKLQTKLQELVLLPNRAQFQIYPLSDVKVGQ